MAEDQTRFGKFAVDVQNFQRTLYALVVSSFLFSAISAVAQGSRIAADPTLAVTTTLFGTVAGAAGVVITYMAWSLHPSAAFAATMRFAAGKHRLAVIFDFCVCLIAMYFYYAAAKNGSDLSLLGVGVGSFFFFRGLVTSALVAKRIEEQAHTWQALSAEERSAWLEAEYQAQIEEAERQRERSALLDEAEEKVRESARTIERAQQTVWHTQRRAFWRRVRGPFDKIRAMSVRVRKAVAGERLLTANERFNELKSKNEIRKARAALEANIAKGFHDEIVGEEVRPLSIEGTDFRFFIKGRQLATLFREPLTQEAAATLVANLRRAQAEAAVENAELLLFVDEAAEASAQARRALAEAGVRTYRAGSWSVL